MGTAHRGDFRGNVRLFAMWLQRPQDLRPLVLEESSLLSPQPGSRLLFAANDQSRFPQILTDMVEIQKELSLGKILLEFVQNPRLSIAHAVNLGSIGQTSPLRRFAPQPGSSFQSAQGGSIKALRFTLSTRRTEAHFPPEKRSGFPPVPMARRFHHRNEAGVDRGDNRRSRWLRRGCRGFQNRPPVLKRARAHCAWAHLDAVMFLDPCGGAGKGLLSAKIGQGARAGACRQPGGLSEGSKAWPTPAQP